VYVCTYIQIVLASLAIVVAIIPVTGVTAMVVVVIDANNKIWCVYLPKYTECASPQSLGEAQS
jgi:hypothetical protein